MYLTLRILNGKRLRLRNGLAYSLSRPFLISPLFSSTLGEFIRDNLSVVPDLVCQTMNEADLSAGQGLGEVC